MDFAQRHIGPAGADQARMLEAVGYAALDELTEGKLRLDEALVNSVSAGEQRVLADARHSTVQIDRPDAVVAAIRAVVDRSGG